MDVARRNHHESGDKGTSDESNREPAFKVDEMNSGELSSLLSLIVADT